MGEADSRPHSCPASETRAGDRLWNRPLVVPHRATDGALRRHRFLQCRIELCAETVGRTKPGTRGAVAEARRRLFGNRAGELRLCRVELRDAVFPESGISRAGA